MCLIALAWKASPQIALALAANRDEFHARPALPAAAAPDDARVFGGIDLQAGGSWLLVAPGRLAAVTNVRNGLSPLPRPRSRGSLVHEFLRRTDTAAAFCAGLQAGAAEFGLFNLLAFDGAHLHFVGNHPEFVRSSLPTGLHALSNGALNAPWPKATALREVMDRWLPAQTSVQQANLEPVFAALRDARTFPEAQLPDTGVGLELERRLSATFIEGEHYGTRCSTIVLFGTDGSLRFEERRFAANGVAAGRSEWRQPAN